MLHASTAPHRRNAMNNSIVPTALPASTPLRAVYAGLAIVFAVIGAVALVQWAFAPQFTEVLDWQQTAVVIYVAGMGALGCLLILPGLFADAGRTE
jgi:hypothetical protein